MSKKLIDLSESLEQASTHCLDVAEQLQRAVKLLSKIKENPPVPLKKLQKIADQIDNIAEDINQMYDDVEEKRLNDDGENNSEKVS